MGTPDDFLETPEGAISLELKTVEVKGKSIPLPTIRDWNPRFPRKLKKQLKKVHGSSYNKWLDTPIKFVFATENLDIYSYHSVDAEKELTELLETEVKNDTNKNS